MALLVVPSPLAKSDWVRLLVECAGESSPYQSVYIFHHSHEYLIKLEVVQIGSVKYLDCKHGSSATPVMSFQVHNVQITCCQGVSAFAL